ncbi:hypothetical protein JOL79_07280 [Microbispora sp. RL4-1S]|uniref:Uncharacterized protein n=1 Tax=Microbispora oryzae TaxID=2806554 RepID=A0A941AH20_9ACTN|nr:hypothetical protein [Microbispora oryzae]MBP2703601.1 hypothetical protein [Microbispora oryzae]
MSPTAGVSGGFSGLNPDALEAFERALGRLEDALGRNEPVIGRELGKIDLDTSGLAVLREARSWIASGRPDLRRRVETIRAEKSEWDSSGVPAELWAFDEALYGKAAHDPEVYAAVRKVTEAAGGGEIDEKALAVLEKRVGDAGFATALMSVLGADRFREAMKATVKAGDQKARRLQAALGKALAAASSRLDPAWRDKLTTGIGPSWRDGLAVASALRYGTYDSRFLTAVAKGLDAWDRKGEERRPGVDPGVMVALMEALSRDPAAAQDFFTEDPTALRHFLVERAMPDQGVALGKALEAATLTFRDHDGSPEHPSRGYLSAKLTSEFVHLEAERIDKGDAVDPPVKPVTTGRILAGYISDIDYVAMKGNDPVVPGVRGSDNPGLAGRDPWGAQFVKDDLRLVMREAFTDAAAFTPVMAAQTASTGWLMDQGAKDLTESKDQGTLLTNAKQVGVGFAFITDAAGLAKIEEGKSLDEAQERNMKILTAVVNTGLAIPQKAGIPIVAGVIGAWTGLIEDAAQGEAESKARSDANSAVDQAHILLHDLTVQAMLKYGAFGAGEPAASTHPWASLEGLKKGDDPRQNPNNFLKDDGRTIMTRSEMIGRVPGGGVDDTRLEAYERWLYEGPSGDPWRSVEDRLDQGFDRGFAQYEP